jgi:hypothetical protein
MPEQEKAFHVGDYVGDEWDRSWRVEEITKDGYIISNPFYNIQKEISNDPNPNQYKKEGLYTEEYKLLRSHDHPDVSKFPIGSAWKCLKKSGLNDPEVDTVTVMHYAYSKGVFWVCNSEKPSLLFLAEESDLQSVEKDIRISTGYKDSKGTLIFVGDVLHEGCNGFRRRVVVDKENGGYRMEGLGDDYRLPYVLDDDWCEVVNEPVNDNETREEQELE